MKDIAEDVETVFGTSNYQLDTPLPKGKNKKLIGLMKDKLGRKIMTKCVGLEVKTYSYLIHDGSEDKKSRSHKKVCHKKALKFESYKSCLEGTQLENKIKYIEKNCNIWY